MKQRLTRLFQMLCNGKRCAYCGRPATAEHHLIRRGASELLRYDPLNGIECCHECHAAIHDGKIDEWSVINAARAERLREMSLIRFNDHLLAVGGQTPEEFYSQCKNRLEKTVLREDDLVCSFARCADKDEIPF